MHDSPLPPNEVSACLFLCAAAGSVITFFICHCFFYFIFSPTLICVHSLLSVTRKRLHMLCYSYLKIKRLVTKDNRFLVARCLGFMCCVTAFLENAQYTYLWFKMTTPINSSSCQRGYVFNDIMFVLMVMALDHYNKFAVYSFTVKGSQGFFF